MKVQQGSPPSGSSHAGSLHSGKVTAVNGNLVTAEFEQPVTQNEVTYVRLGELRLKSELIRIRGRFAEMQVFEDTTGLKAGETDDERVVENRRDSDAAVHGVRKMSGLYNTAHAAADAAMLMVGGAT